MKYFSFVITAVIFLSACESHENDKPVIARPASSYHLDTIKKTGVPTLIKLPAQLAAYQQVSIFPKVNAYVKTVAVDIGDKVRAGQLLMTLEAPELQQATLQAKEKYARAKADFSIDKEHYQRLLEAAGTPGAVSALDLSTMRAKMDADSSLSNAEKNNWQMQEQMQTYLTVKAPFAGIITERNVYPGALVNAMEKGRPMLELKEESKLRLRVDVPETQAPNLRVHDSLAFYTSALPGKKITGFISRKAMNVDPQFRSERVEADVDNNDGLLSPGMYADVVMRSRGNTSAWSVPSAAVVVSTERKFIWVLANGKAQKVDVSTGNVSSGRTEIYGNITDGQQVIANPDDQLKEGQPISR